MINYLRGKHGTMEYGGAITVILRDEIGYRVLVSDRDREVINKRGVGGEVELFVRTFSTENEVTLYGFLLEYDRYVFDALIRVPNVGVSKALRLLSGISGDAFRLLVEKKDTASLTKLPGFGKKTAETILAEVTL